VGIPAAVCSAILSSFCPLNRAVSVVLALIVLDQASQLSEQCQKHFTEPFERNNVISAGSTGALHSLHASNVILADVKPENILLDESDKVYLIDFSGSWIDGKSGSALESVRFFLPRDIKLDSTVRTDIFALGSTLYEVMTGTQPYKDLSDEEVEQLFQQGKFPSLDLISCGQIIEECWTGVFQSVDDVLVALQRVQKSTQSASLGN
jgi:serine/threonine protein kinase